MAGSNADILQALGRLQEGVDRLREDFQEEKALAHESRAKLHSRLDDQAKEIAHLETTVAISGEIDAQIRGQISGLKATVEPQIEEWKRIKTLGMGVSVVLVATGITVGGFLVAAGDAAVSAIRAWLRIQ